MQLFQAWTNIKDETPPHPTIFLCVFNFIPWPQLDISTIQFQTFKEHHTKSCVISNYRVYEIICVIIVSMNLKSQAMGTMFYFYMMSKASNSH
jgi:hypothetical protein